VLQKQGQKGAIRVMSVRIAKPPGALRQKTFPNVKNKRETRTLVPFSSSKRKFRIRCRTDQDQLLEVYG
jgi:hypothetical protein